MLAVSSTLWRWSLFLGCCGVLALGCYTAAISLSIPGTPWDSGTYLYIGSLVADGKLPYRDGLDTKNPGIFFIYAAAKLLLGPGIAPLRVFDIGWEFLTALVIACSCWRIWRSVLPAMFGAGIYLALYFTQWHTMLGQADGMLNLPLALAVLALLTARAGDSALPWFLAGMCLGCAMILKITAAAFGLLFVSALFFGKRIESTRVVFALLGWSIPLAACAAYFWLKGGFSEMLEAQFVIAPAYAAWSRENFNWSKATRFFSLTFILPLLAAAGLGMLGLLAAKIRNSVSFATTLPMVWTVSAVACMAIQMRFMNTHYMALMGPLAMLAASGFAIVTQHGDRLWIKLLAVAGIAALLLAPVKRVPEQLDIAASEAISPDILLAKRLEQLTRPEDKLFVWGTSPSIYVYSNRAAASRFVTAFLVGEPFLHLGFRPEFLAAFRSEKPVYFVLEKSPNGFTNDFFHSEATFESFPELHEILRTDYEQTEESKFFRVFRRK